MAKTVMKIPATVSRFTAAPINSNVKRKVAGYARVSTDHEEQLTSYDAQLDYYTNYINSHDDWEFAGMYSDEGISGTNTKHREGFKSMIDDALAGKIDLIVTKSVSRFARNTVDSLTTVRTLKENGIEVYFEKENIWTLDSKGELLITIMSSLAQEESRSISENVTWGHRKRFADGKASVAYRRFLGYDKGENGEWVINEEQAETVRLVYKFFLEGLSYKAVAKKLSDAERLTPGGLTNWNTSTVKSILTNEKYRGDALLQKGYTVDFLTKKTKKNEGEVPQYYVEDHHPAIIEPDVFELVQLEIEKRKKRRKRHSGVSIFSSKIKCGNCGGWYGSKVWHSNDEYRRVIWQCNEKYKKGTAPCDSPHFTEDEVKAMFIKAMNKFLEGKNEVLADMKTARGVVNDTSALERERQDQAEEMNVVAELIENCIAENARIAQNQPEYQERYNELVSRYEKAKDRYEAADTAIRDKTARYKELGQLIKRMKDLDGPVQEFDESLWGLFVDYITVYSRKDIRFTFKDGTEVIC